MINNNDTYINSDSYKKDCLNDLIRWIYSFKYNLNEYSIEKYYYELEKRLKVRDEDTINKMSIELSEYRNSFKDIRMGIDWFKLKFEYEPNFLKTFYSEMLGEINRLKNISTYLTKRARELSNRGFDNTSTKNMRLYIICKINIINMLFTSKYSKRRQSNNIIPYSNENK